MVDPEELAAFLKKDERLNWLKSLVGMDLTQRRLEALKKNDHAKELERLAAAARRLETKIEQKVRVLVKQVTSRPSAIGDGLNDLGRLVVLLRMTNASSHWHRHERKQPKSMDIPAIQKKIAQRQIALTRHFIAAAVRKSKLEIRKLNAFWAPIPTKKEA